MCMCVYVCVCVCVVGTRHHLPAVPCRAVAAILPDASAIDVTSAPVCALHSLAGRVGSIGVRPETGSHTPVVAQGAK